MHFKGKTNLFLICISCFIISVWTTPIDYKQMYELEQVKRHIEIRRELEKEATPFIVGGKKTFDIASLMSIEGLSSSKTLVGIPTTWTNFFSTFTFVDFVMGIFSLVALGLGSFYMLWRMNPFAPKVDK